MWTRGVEPRMAAESAEEWDSAQPCAMHYIHVLLLIHSRASDFERKFEGINRLIAGPWAGFQLEIVSKTGVSLNVSRENLMAPLCTFLRGEISFGEPRERRKEKKVSTFNDFEGEFGGSTIHLPGLWTRSLSKERLKVRELKKKKNKKSSRPQRMWTRGSEPRMTANRDLNKLFSATALRNVAAGDVARARQRDVNGPGYLRKSDKDGFSSTPKERRPPLTLVDLGRVNVDLRSRGSAIGVRFFAARIGSASDRYDKRGPMDWPGASREPEAKVE
ncbi:hypothetical protein DFH06DRAFT_1299269 [Mycena polygramma]|nr:hypothetical protein DFH06DRAFT_1299269 [Mycena polygramma]